MNSSDSTTWGIGDVARRTGVTERTLRYYEELGLLAPDRDGGGRRRYGGGDLDRLYRIRLLRELGTPLADVDPDSGDLQHLTRQHLTELDERMAELARVRERVRAVEDRLLHGVLPGDDALLDLLSGLATDEPSVTRRTTLLVYRDIAAAHSYLVDVLGLAPGPIEYDGERAVHGEVHAGDGVVWLHR
ncbi:MerR family transcriptional regulator (fragment), partial [Rhodococcus sp. AW25M09]|uniref:helix-turn-helix domain-containing protein n=1 Tax=Rhodococcus sp. AW25M09 TaxID=1268303 RepID=UPI0002ABFF9D